jgi:colanic acid biosynthesis glycosyl transferase WcaI
VHVVFLNRSYWPDTGATGQLLTELAEDLVRVHGFDVTVVTGYPLRRDRRVPASETRNGVHVVRARGTVFDPRRFAGRALNYVTYFLSSCAVMLAGRRLVAGARRADVIVALTDPPIIGLAAALGAWRSGARLVFLCQDVFPEVAVLVEGFRSRLVDAILDRIGRFIIRKADRVVALGDTMKRRLVATKGADPSRVEVIHNWADCAALTPAPRSNAFSRAHGLDGRFVVMHAGNIGLSQDFDVVLDAAARLAARDDVVFVLIGDGARRMGLQQDVAARGLPNVRFIPFQPREAMRESYASADVFLVTLKPGLAGFIVPSKLYGILAAGRPSVTAVEEDSEAVQITREYACGIVVPPGDGAALADAIVRLRADSGLRETLGSNARAAALAFDRPRQVAAYAFLLRQLVSGAAMPGAARIA